MIPGHRLERKLREVAEREVWQGTFGEVRCVTRILRGRAMVPGFARALETAVVEGRGSYAALGDDIAMTVEGYGVAARLMGDPGTPPRWPRALAAGLTAAGLPFVTTQWIEGTPLHELTVALGPVEADAALRSLVDSLDALHARLVAFGDLKLANLVLRPDGGLALIDLDTVREVPAPDGGAPTRDRTVNWAAPEQLHGGQTWLASDVWALRRLITSLFPEGPPAPWPELALACGHPDPLCRPTAHSCRAFLAGEGDLVDVYGRDCSEHAGGAGAAGPFAAHADMSAPAATERVEEAAPAAATERVADPPAPAPQRTRAPPAPAAPQPAESGCLGAIYSMGKVAAAVGALSALLCCGGLAWWDASLNEEADRKAEELLGELKLHKIDPLKNGAGERERLAAGATALWDDRPTSRTCAVRALATVWEQRWQFDSAWSQADYDEGSAAANNPLCRAEPEVALARTTLHAGACRRRFSPALSAADCALAMDAAAEFWKRVPASEGHHWMRVEAAWQEVRSASATAGRMLELKNPEGVPAAQSAMERCIEAEPWLPFAPVNGPELLDECMVVAGYVGEVGPYLHAAELRLASLPSEEHKTARRRVLTSLYQAAGLGCHDTRVTWNRKGSLQAVGAAWCVALGHLARGCVTESAQTMAEGALGDTTHPWAELAGSLGRQGPCLQ